MFSNFERFVAFRYLRARRGERFVSVITGFSLVGIALGVATLIIVMAVMNGFRAELIGRILGLNGHINVMQVTPSQSSDYQNTLDTVVQVDGVTKVLPMIEGQALMKGRRSSGGVIIRGYAETDLKKKDLLYNGILDNQGFSLQGNSALIGKALARSMNLDIGQEFSLIAPEGKATPFGTVPLARRFEVAGIFDVGMYEYNANFVFIPLDSARSLLFPGYGPNAISSLEVHVTNPEQVDKVTDQIAAVAPSYVHISDWRQVNSSFYGALKVERNVMFLILTLIILVAAFNIISSLIMMVKDKGRDIAILRSFGATRSNIMRIFFLQGAGVGVIGTALGSGLGVLITLNLQTIQAYLEGLTGGSLFSAEVYFLTQLPAQLKWDEVGLVVAMALGLSFLATLYPAWRAAKLDPVEALRYE